MKRQTSFISVILLLLCFVNTLGAYAQIPTDTSYHKIYIVSHGWHTGIIVKTNEAIPYLPIFNRKLSNTEFLEIGWGDKDFFTAEIGTLWLALKAVLVPTRSVLLVSGYDKNPYYYFNLERIRELNLTQESYIQLLSYLSGSFALQAETQQAVEVLEISETRCFYLSNEKYHAFKTCNVWTARALKRLGLKVHPFWAFTSGNIMRQVRRVEKKTNESKIS